MSDSTEDDDEEDEAGSRLNEWINPWGFAVVAVGALSLFQAVLMGYRTATAVLAAAGLLVLWQGIRATRRAPRKLAGVWLAFGGLTNLTILVLAAVAPGVLNGRWALDRSVPKVDRNRRVVLPRDRLFDAGRPLGPDDWVDAAAEAVRQHDLTVRVESLRVGPRAEDDPTPRVLIHLRLASVGHESAIPFEGFGRHPPALADESGRTYPFREERLASRRRVPRFSPPPGPTRSRFPRTGPWACSWSSTGFRQRTRSCGWSFLARPGAGRARARCGSQKPLDRFYPPRSHNFIQGVPRCMRRRLPLAGPGSR